MSPLYVVLRDTLDAGALAAQTAHVVSAFACLHPRMHSEWHGGDGVVVVLAAPGDQLAALHDEFVRAGVPAASFREPDLGDAVTGVALACPRAHALVRKHLRRLPLAGRASAAA